jgi:hypothetical protein
MALTFTVGGVSGASAADVKIKDSYFKYGGVKYFRGKSENVQLGSYGEKKTPAGKPNYLAIEKNIKTQHLDSAKVKVAGPFNIDWSKQSKKHVEATGGLKFFKNSGGTAALTHKKAKQAKLKLMKFFIHEGAMKTTLNKQADGARSYLKKEGKDGRVVTEVWVVMEAKLANSISNAGSVSASSGNNGIKIKARGETTETITLAPGTTFAYLMHKVKKWNKGKKKITDMEDDQKGLN